MTVRTLRLIATCVIASLLSCNTYKEIYSDHDKSVDFTKYASFAWLPDSIGLITVTDSLVDSRYDNDVIRNNTVNYVNHCLIARDYIIDVDQPDLGLQLILLNELKEVIVSAPPFHQSDYYYSNPYYYPYYYPYVDYYTFTGSYGQIASFQYENGYSYSKTFVKGTIIINMYDMKTGQMVWTGSAEGNIYDPDQLKEDVHPAVHAILQLYPVKAEKHRAKMR